MGLKISLISTFGNQSGWRRRRPEGTFLHSIAFARALNWKGGK
jgi:hypothetical protein